MNRAYGHTLSQYASSVFSGSRLLVLLLLLLLLTRMMTMFSVLNDAIVGRVWLCYTQTGTPTGKATIQPDHELTYG